MTRVIRQVALLTLKDLRVEARGRQTLGLVAVLGVLIIAVLGLGLNRQVGGVDATAVLWVAYLFGGVLSFEKTMAAEREDADLAGLLMAPVDRGVLYLAKLLSNLVLMAALAAVITPVAILFFGFDLSAAPWGFAAIGTLFAAAIASTRLQGGLLAMLVFPISLPLVIASPRGPGARHSRSRGEPSRRRDALPDMPAAAWRTLRQQRPEQGDRRWLTC